MSDAYQKLIKTLRTVFEMDKADLDFGIYRILNQKRAEINQFLEKDLLPQVEAVFADYAAGGKSELQAELMQAIEQARRFGVADPENAPPVVALKQKLASAVDLTALENEVYSHLHTFFSRYYDKGDFISQRRYKTDTYAIPYEGEEVKLYWANHDQYYIKSSERLRDYAFTVQGHDGKIIRIKLVEADTEKDNVKAKVDEERRFVLDAEQPLAVVDGELQIRFFYVPAGKKTQDALNEEAVRTISQQKDFKDWLIVLQTRASTEKNPNRTLLEKHLNDYTARNTFDYFIHKDLGGFLRRELDFYIKNEVLYLDDIDDAAFAVTEQHLRKIKVIRTIALKIIRLLAQIEDFQKKLWLKKKFVVETQYCITLDRVPEALYPRIAANQAQHDEWVKLFAINEIKKSLENPGYVKPLTVNFLKANDKLVLDTRFFDEDLKNRLLASIEDFDKNCDGLLINSENFQVLNLLNKRYQEQVKCIYIDPPYNTDNDDFPYKDGYKASAWFCMMHDRAKLASLLMSKEGLFFQQIGDDESARSRLLLDNIFSERKNSIVARRGVKNVQAQFNDISRLNIGHDIIHVYAKKTALRIPHLQHNLEDDKPGKWDTFWRGTDRPTMRYDLLGQNPRTGQWRWEKKRSFRAVENYEYYMNYEADNKSIDEWYIENLQAGVDLDFVRKNTEGTVQYYVPPQTYKLVSDNWLDIPSAGSFTEFPHEKSLALLQRIISWITDIDDLVLDYFAGSGSTAHAAIRLSTHEIRKYILVEMGEYFDNILKPRIAKVIYSDTWKDGKPTSRATGVSHCFKYLRLESYEDALNNLRLKDRTKPQQSLLNDNPALREDYLLGYWLDVETADSPSLLNIDQFEDPFNYQLNIATGSVGAFKPTRVDLVETFNYLIGLRVKHTDTLRGFKVITGTNPKDESVLIIWRNLKEKDNAALEDFLNKQQYNPRDTEFDHLYVNGDHTLDDPHSKVKMIEIEFKRLMFDTQDV